MLDTKQENALYGADVPAQFGSPVRVARQSELQPIMEMAGKIHVENGIGPEWKMDLVRRYVFQALQGKSASISVIGELGKIEASMFLFLNHLWYNDDYWVLEDRWVFVDPQYRNGPDHLIALLEFAKHWAECLNVPLIFSVLSTVRTEAKMRLYRRVFGEMSGGFFLVNAKTGQHNRSGDRTDVGPHSTVA